MAVEPAADAAARDGRRQRPGRHGGGADRPPARPRRLDLGARRRSSAASSRSPAWRPSKREVLRFRDYQSRRLDELGVEIHLRSEVTPATVARERPTSSSSPPAPSRCPADPRHRPADRPRRADVAARTRSRSRAGDHVVVVGGSATGCETAELLAGTGAVVSMLEMRAGVGYGIEAITRRHLVRQLKSEGVTILTTSKVIMIEDDHVLYEDADGATHALRPTSSRSRSAGGRPAARWPADRRRAGAGTGRRVAPRRLRQRHQCRRRRRPHGLTGAATSCATPSANSASTLPGA